MTVEPRLDEKTSLQIVHFDAAIIGLNPLSDTEQQAISDRSKEFFSREQLGCKFLICVTGDSEDCSTAVREISAALRKLPDLWVSESTLHSKPSFETDDEKLALFRVSKEAVSLAVKDSVPMDLSNSLRVVVRRDRPLENRRVLSEDGAIIALSELVNSDADDKLVGLVPLGQEFAFYFYGIVTEASKSKVREVERIAQEVAMKHSLSVTINWTDEGDLSFPRP